MRTPWRAIIALAVLGIPAGTAHAVETSGRAADPRGDVQATTPYAFWDVRSFELSYDAARGTIRATVRAYPSFNPPEGGPGGPDFWVRAGLGRLKGRSGCVAPDFAGGALTGGRPGDVHVSMYEGAGIPHMEVGVVGGDGLESFDVAYPRSFEQTYTITDPALKGRRFDCVANVRSEDARSAPEDEVASFCLTRDGTGRCGRPSRAARLR